MSALHKTVVLGFARMAWGTFILLEHGRPDRQQFRAEEEEQPGVECMEDIVGKGYPTDITVPDGMINCRGEPGQRCPIVQRDYTEHPPDRFNRE